MLSCKNVIILIFCFVTLIACDKKSADSSPSSNTPEAGHVLELPQDSGMFIGLPVYLSRHEFSVDLYLKDSVEVNDDIHEFLQGSTDSVVYQDDDFKRSLLPKPIAEEYLDLVHLEYVNLYDSLGTQVDRADLQQIEFYEDLIETRIIAVYRSQNVRKVAYVIGGDAAEDRVAGFSSRALKDPGLAKTVGEKIPSLSDPANRLTMIHRRMEPGGVIYSFASDRQRSYIFDHKTSEILYARNDMTFLQIVPVHKERNGRPVFVAVVGQPETDLIWTTLLVFDGREYNSTLHQRLNKPIAQ